MGRSFFFPRMEKDALRAMEAGGRDSLAAAYEAMAAKEAAERNRRSAGRGGVLVGGSCCWGCFFFLWLCLLCLCVCAFLWDLKGSQKEPHLFVEESFFEVGFKRETQREHISFFWGGVHLF